MVGLGLPLDLGVLGHGRSGVRRASVPTDNLTAPPNKRDAPQGQNAQGRNVGPLQGQEKITPAPSGSCTTCAPTPARSRYAQHRQEEARGQDEQVANHPISLPPIASVAHRWSRRHQVAGGVFIPPKRLWVNVGAQPVGARWGRPALSGAGAGRPGLRGPARGLRAPAAGGLARRAVPADVGGVAEAPLDRVNHRPTGRTPP